MSQTPAVQHQARPVRGLRPPPPVARSGRTSIYSVIPLLALCYSFLLFPIELKVNVGGLNIYAFRAAIIILAFLNIRRIFAFIKGFSLIDALVLFSCLWTLISFTYRDGIQGGLVRSAAIFIDTFGAYLIARTSIRSLNDVRIFLIMLAPGLLVAGTMVAVESLTGRLIVRPLFSSVFGSAVSYEAGVARGAVQLLNEERLGLLRAFGPFSYPILGGTILASALPLFLMSGLKRWPLILGIVASCMAFFSLSSAAFIGLALGIALYIADRILPRFRPVNWNLVVSVGAAYALAVNFLLESGIVGVIGRFTLNPATAYIRRQQWYYGTQSIAEHPFFGIGFAEIDRAFWMTAAIDAHFLLIGIRDGLITPVLLFLAAVVMMVMIGRKSSQVSKVDRDLLVGLNITLTVLLFASMTVTYFSEANVWFMAILGIGAACAAIPRAMPMRVPMQTRRPAPPAGMAAPRPQAPAE